jgi:hypothetical protein
METNPMAGDHTPTPSKHTPCRVPQWRCLLDSMVLHLLPDGPRCGACTLR